MATNDKPTPAAPAAPKAPSLSDTQARDSFIAVALREIIAWQLAEGKTNHDQAGVLAVRYANSTMAVRGVETAPLKVVVSKGTLVDPAIPGDDKTVAAVVDGDKIAPPKSIAEIIGEAEPVEEVK